MCIFLGFMQYYIGDKMFLNFVFVETRRVAINYIVFINIPLITQTFVSDWPFGIYNTTQMISRRPPISGLLCCMGEDNENHFTKHRSDHQETIIPMISDHQSYKVRDRGRLADIVTVVRSCYAIVCTILV